MNILFDKKARKKKKSFFQFRPYYELEKLTMKEKLYTFFYNLESTGFTTLGESSWSLRMFDMFPDNYRQIKSDFQKDFLEFETTKKC